MNRDAVNIEELRRRARRRLPRLLFDYIDGGAGDESGLKRNTASFAGYRLSPRYLLDIGARTTATSLWERRFAAPFGIAPVGLAGLFYRDGELLFAQAARDAGIPYVMSGASIASIEEVTAIDSQSTWYQLYPARDRGLTLDIVRRAADAGVAVLVITVDLPVPAKRERDIRNGFDYDLRLSPSLALDALKHPRWTLDHLCRGGLPSFGTWARYAGTGASAREVARFFLDQGYPTLTWVDMEKLRRDWPGRLIIKGLLHADDARMAAAIGADGVIVSNHGGRQLACLPTALEALPEIRAAVGDRMRVMVDGGIRCGSDVAIALGLGADFVFIGRAALYGLAAAGYEGVLRSVAILKEELDLTMGQIGVTSVPGLRSALVS